MFNLLQSQFPGFSPSQIAYTCARLISGDELLVKEGFPGVVLIVVPRRDIGETVVEDLRFFLKQNSNDITVQSFFRWEVLPFEQLSPPAEISAERISTLHRLASGKPCVIVASVEALMQRIVSPEVLLNSQINVQSGIAIERDEFIKKIENLGYLKSSLVEEVGQLAVRGAVIDLFPPEYNFPIRLELFGDYVESIRSFDSLTQRSIETLSQVEILPVREFFIGGRVEEFKEKIKECAKKLAIPSRMLSGLEEALETGSPWPGIEHLQPFISDSVDSFWRYLPEDVAVVVCDNPAVEAAIDDFSDLVSERATRAETEGILFPEPKAAYDESDDVISELNTRTNCTFDTVGFISEEDLNDEPKEDISREKVGRFLYSNSGLETSLMTARHLERPFKPLVDEITNRRRDGIDTAIVVSHSSRVKRLTELLEAYDIVATHFIGSFLEWRENAGTVRDKVLPITILDGFVSSGLRSPSESFQLISEREIFPESTSTRRVPKTSSIRRFLGAASELQQDDYIVHVEHGIGIYRGLKQLTIEGKIGDFLDLEYAGAAKLYLPVEHIGKIQKYAGAEGKKPTLHKLGGKAWEKTKGKVKEQVQEIAGQLITLYAEREIAPGFSFGSFNNEDAQFADTFPFELTPDQAQAITELLEDMEKPKPMDRLVCGDVGYGKTEVALRGAFKAVNAGKQVAILVPTTILADQHFQTFKERFNEFPFEVRCVSRFFQASENRETLEQLRKGKVDIIIGTHRLLQKDVFFKDLGLVVIDEEHRFGVTAKERLKKLRQEIDVLTLTATPIPRTLHMSLVGIRNLSVIETPPCDRQVIRTYLTRFDQDNQGVVREAILRELGRSGQIFYIHNRVQSIELVADEVRELVPEARVVVGHGQMKEKELETVMHKFLSHQADVLVSTTIVESGLDIPNANTIIIRDADRFGLAELYQLRGRVGRSSRRAYAYLLVNDSKTLGIDAKKRLKVLQSLDDLGVGFRLALQDMEIRGAGNLLGRDQSGHIHLVGFELYSQILKDTVREIRAKQELGEENGITTELRPVVDPDISIGFPVHIPPSYIPDVAERILLYQRLVNLEDKAAGVEIYSEIEDRCGKVPEEVETLIESMILRSLLKRALIVQLLLRNDKLTVSFHPDAPIDVDKLLDYIATTSQNIKLSPEKELSIDFSSHEVKSPSDIYDYLSSLLYDIGCLG